MDCSQCLQTREVESFSKSQQKKSDDVRRCNDCVSKDTSQVAKTDHPLLECSMCHQSRPREAFSKSQVSKSAPKCLWCLPPPPVTEVATPVEAPETVVRSRPIARNVAKAEEVSAPTLVSTDVVPAVGSGWPCIGCHQLLPPSAFHPNQRESAKDGIPRGYAWCKICVDTTNPSRWPAFPGEGVQDMGKLPGLHERWITPYWNSLMEKAEVLCPTSTKRDRVPLNGLFMLSQVFAGLQGDSWHFTIFPAGYDIGLPKGRRDRPLTKDATSAWLDSIPDKGTFLNFKCFPDWLFRLLFRLIHTRANTGDVMAVVMIFVMLRDHVDASSKGTVSECDLKQQLMRQYSLNASWKAVA